MERTLLSPGDMTACGKILYGSLGAAGLFSFCLYVCTEIGLRREGWHEVVVEMHHAPHYGAVGQTYFTPDGSRVMVTAVRRGENGSHRMHASVQGVHRYALAGLPPDFRWEHTFSMDTAALEWTLRQASGAVASAPASAGRQWHALH